MVLTTKDKISYFLCIASFTIGAILTFLGFFVSPVGEIHSSVLTSLGIFLTFSGSLIGISAVYSNELHTFKTEIHRTINERAKKKKENEQ